MIRSMTVAGLSLCAIVGPALAAVPTHADLSYGDTFNQSLDVFLPTISGPGPFPVVMYIHGGAWLSGDKTQVEPHVDALLARGFAVVSINHRLTFQSTWPAQLHDCKGAVRWVRAHAAEYNLRPGQIAAFGESTGGHLAAMLAVTSGDASLEGTVGGNNGFSSAIKAAVDAYGPINLVEFAQYSGSATNAVTLLIGLDIHEIIEHQAEAEYASWVALVNSANPLTHVNAGDPPIYIYHGMADASVPHQHAQMLANALSAASIPNTLRLLPGGVHDMPPAELPAVCDFLAAHLGGDGGGGDPTPPPLYDLAMGGLKKGDNFGHSVTVLGDINGDSIDDLALAAPYNDDRGTDAGMVSVHSGANGATLTTLRGRRGGDRFGWAVAPAGDVNGDGIPDVIIASPLSDLSAADAGRFEVFAGGTWQRLLGINGPKAGDQLGYSVAGVDIDGDGISEIAAGAPFANGPGSDSGSVYVYNIAGQLLRRIKGLASNDHLGWSVASAGDVDGDGREDVLVGAPHADVNGANSGTATIVSLEASAWITRFTVSGDAGEQLGAAVAGIGDASGDSLADVIIGAPEAIAQSVRSGVARVYSPANGSLLANLEPVSAQAGEQFGAALAGIGDADGDGLADVAVGSWAHTSVGAYTGRVSVYRGVGGLLRLIGGPETGAKFGRCVAGAGDLNGDGLGDLIVGASGMFWDGIRRGVVYSYPPVAVP